MAQHKTISIPKNVFSQLESELKHSVFSSVDDLALFILQNYLEQKNRAEPETGDEEALRERLKNLGYL